MALLAGLVPGRPPGARGWSLALVAVVVVALGATLPVKLRDAGDALNQQRKLYRGTAEQVSREKCLNDNGRADLVETLALVRDLIPEDGRFHVRSVSSVACIMINLFPREPVRRRDLDPASDWQILDRKIPAELDRELRETGGDDRYVVLTPGFVLVRPEGG